MDFGRMFGERVALLGGVLLCCCACSPQAQGSQQAGTQSVAGACAAQSCAASVAAGAAGTASTLPPAAASNAASAPRVAATAGMSAPPSGANQAGRAAPPSLPMAGGAAGALAGRGGVQPPLMGVAAAGSGADAALAGVTADEIETLRNACVEGINMYRAMLPNLKPLKRASAAQETCSELGAQMDGDAMSPHMSARAGLCARMGLYSENTCGGFPGGNAMAIANSLKFCVQGFWAEGEPPGTREMCMMDLQGCYEQHGHYINMTDPNIGSVACAFYKMKDGSYWLNHDFGR